MGDQLDQVPTRASFWNFLPGNWKFFTVLALPLALVWLCFIPSYGKEGREYYCLYIMALTGLYWALDCMPMAAAAFIPVILFPLFLIDDARTMSNKYMQDVGMMTFGSSILALAAVTSGLSKRFAYKILSLVGADLERILLLSMLLGALLSMWLVNTATMLFLMHMVEEIIMELISGAEIGTLGDSRMAIWKAASEAGSQEMVQKPINPDSKEETTPVPEANPNPVVVEDTELPQSATTSLGSLAEFADELGDMDFVEETSSPGSAQQLTVRQSIEAEKSKTSLLTADSLHVAPVLEESVLSEKLASLKNENKALLQSYKLKVFHGMAVAASIGGLLWPYGSTSSIAIFYYQGLKGFQPVMYFNQVHWMNFTFPIVVISLAFASCWIYILTFKVSSWCKVSTKDVKITLAEATYASDVTRARVQEAFKEKYESKGALDSHEIGVLVVLTITILLFVLRSPEVIPGWGSYFEFVQIKDSTIAALAALLAFVIPKCGTDMFKGPKSPQDKATFTALVPWKCVQQSFPWGLLIFIGGGTAIAHGCVKSKFNENIVNGLVFMLSKSKAWPWLVLLISIVLTTGLAHLVTGTAAAHISAHILMQLSKQLGFGWCYLPIPCVVACSFAFLTPAGTTPMAMAHMKSQKLNSFACIIRGWPITIFSIALVFAFGVFYTDELMACQN